MGYISVFPLHLHGQRAASFVYCGERNGYGYRDTVQDIQGVIHTDPEAALEKIRFMLSAQVDNGGGLPLVRFDHDERAGHEEHRMTLIM